MNETILILAGLGAFVVLAGIVLEARHLGEWCCDTEFYPRT